MFQSLMLMQLSALSNNIFQHNLMETNPTSINHQSVQVLQLESEIMVKLAQPQSSTVNSSVKRIKQRNIALNRREGKNKLVQSQSELSINNNNSIKNKNNNRYSKMLRQRPHFRNLTFSNQGNIRAPGPEKDKTPQHQILLLEAKIKKKDDLIRYLERKCGQHIMKSTSGMLKEIGQLKHQNQQLSDTLSNFTQLKPSPFSQQYGIPLLKYDDVTKRVLYDQEFLQSLNDQELINAIVNQSKQMHSVLQSLQQRSPSINQFLEDTPSNANALNQGSPLCQLNQDHSETGNKANWQQMELFKLKHLIENNTRQYSASCSLRDTRKIRSRFTSPQARSERVQNSHQNQGRINELEQQFNFVQEAIAITKSELQKLQKQIKLFSPHTSQLQQEIINIKSQLGCLSEKIDHCYQSLLYIEQSRMNSQQGHPKEQLKYSRLQQDYMEILAIFNVDYGGDSHQKLLHEIVSFKNQVSSMVKSNIAISEDKNNLEVERDFWRDKCQALDNLNTELQSTFQKGMGELQMSNELIMRKNFELLALKLKFKSSLGNSKQKL